MINHAEEADPDPEESEKATESARKIASKVDVKLSDTGRMASQARLKSSKAKEETKSLYDMNASE